MYGSGGLYQSRRLSLRPLDDGGHCPVSLGWGGERGDDHQLVLVIVLLPVQVMDVFFRGAQQDDVSRTNDCPFLKVGWSQTPVAQYTEEASSIAPQLLECSKRQSRQSGVTAADHILDIALLPQSPSPLYEGLSTPACIGTK